jgi:phosphatidylinositol-3-phosphatase
MNDRTPLARHNSVWKFKFGTAVVLLLFAVGIAASEPFEAPPIRHVFLIVLENKSYADTFESSSQDPYLKRTLTQQGALLTRYYGTGHSSLDNYIAMVSGQAATRETEADCEVFSDFALKKIDADGQAVGTGCVYPSQIKTLADQLESAGLTWKGYMEDMGNDPARENAACAHPVINTKDQTQSPEAPLQGAPAGDQYAVRHNPFMYFHSIIDQPSCAQHVVNLHELADDLRSAGTTPNFSFITPNLCDDGHDGDGTGAAGKGCVDGNPGGLTSTDAFLKTWVPRILQSAAYQEDGLLIITFDEGDFSPPETVTDPRTGITTVTTRAAGEHCCGQRMGPNIIRPVVQSFVESPKLTDLVKIQGYGGDRIGAVVLSRFVKPGTVSNVPYNHYSLLKSLEDIYHLDRLGYATQPGLKTFGRDVFTGPQ